MSLKFASNDPRKIRLINCSRSKLINSRLRSSRDDGNNTIVIVYEVNNATRKTVSRG